MREKILKVGYEVKEEGGFQGILWLRGIFKGIFGVCGIFTW